MKVLVTRPKSEENASLKELFHKELGIEVDILELVKIKPIYPNIEQAVELLKDYEYIVFTSQNGVEIFFNYLKKNRINLDLSNKNFAAIGPKTAEKINSFIKKNVTIPPIYTSENLKNLLSQIESKCLILRSVFSNPIKLTNVNEIYIYELVPIEEVSSIGYYKYVVLTSSFITRIFFEKFGKGNFDFFVPIGPLTYKELIKYVDESRIIPYPENHTITNALKLLIKFNK
ncbi:MAG: uroporphyrinogen-III synthase [bacterium]